MAIEVKVKQEDKKIKIDFPILMVSDSGNILLVTGYDNDGYYKGILLQTKGVNFYEGYTKTITDGWSASDYEPLEGEVVLRNK